ncbi:hypothetical protein [Nannocystis punicea]|uniref:Uncharacterized protein n=1 Tax=Nannocystis punicea TaxID=2995304 RepID=A0ABY7H9B3_9BACT|nr:hypothetical protein [Nannocystis poenicansa]WAS95865.1 hypothetical protein O0S08_06850 [Nannocystis poenicansa]
MRTPALFSLALTSALAAACDDDLELVDADEPVAFRCGIPCVNSPYLGSYDITNLTYRHGFESVSPDGEHSMSWTGTKSGATISAINVTVDGTATVSLSTGSTVPIVGSRLDLVVNYGGTTTNGKVWFAGVTTEPGDEDDSFTVTRYDIRTNVYPGPAHEFVGTEKDPWWTVCPANVHGSNMAVLLSDTHADSIADGSIGWVNYDYTEFAIACDGHSLAKGVTELNVVPRSGHARSYGYDHYSSLMQGWQAVFQGQSRTFLGAPVGVVDTAHSPPLFHTLGPIPLPPPIIGQYQWVLESVYKDTGTATRGARCKFTGNAYRLQGEHRNSAYDPPVAQIAGWSSLPECSGNLSQYGDVAFYSVAHIIFQQGGGGGS